MNTIFLLLGILIGQASGIIISLINLERVKERCKNEKQTINSRKQSNL